MSNEIDHLRESQTLARQLLVRQDEAYDRIAEALHEKVMQDLFAARNFLELALDDLNPRMIDKVRGDLLRVANDLRSLVGDLRPVALTYADVQSVLEGYCVNFEYDQGLPLAFHTDSDADVSVPDRVRVSLGRILQESVENAWKHAQAQQVEVALDLQSDRLCLEVRDDGVGFEVPASLLTWVEQGKLGLASMRERAEGVGGTFHVESQSGHGTRVFVDIPLS